MKPLASGTMRETVKVADIFAFSVIGSVGRPSNARLSSIQQNKNIGRLRHTATMFNPRSHLQYECACPLIGYASQRLVQSVRLHALFRYLH